MSLQPGLRGAAADVFGGSFVGNLITTLCFGAVSVQAMVYFATFPKDPLSTGLTVLFLCTVQVFQVACVTEALWYYFVTSYSDPFALLDGNWQLSIYQLSSVLQSGTVQTFFAYRVYQLSNSLAFGATVGLFALVQSVFGMIVCVKANIIRSFIEIVLQIRWLVTIWLGIQCAADVVIALSMVYLLQQRRTGFKNTDNMLNLMTIWTINTGLVTAMLSVIVLVFFAIYGFHFVVLSLGLPMGGFYSFTMMANLHSRSHIAQKIHRSHGSGEPPQAWQMNNLPRSPLTEYSHSKATNSMVRSFGRATSPRTLIVIGVAREEEQVVEEYEIVRESQYLCESSQAWAPPAQWSPT